MSMLVGDWGSHWLPKVKPACRTRLREIGSADPGRLSWRRWGEECSVSIDEAGRLALAEAMLDKVIAANSVKSVDRPILADITNRALDDLIGRISWLIDQDRAPPIHDGEGMPGPGISWEISLKRSGMAIGLTVHSAALIRWRKALAPLAGQPGLTRLATALQEQKLQVGLAAGQGALSLAELENLAVGDVVVLDRRVEGPLELLAEGTPTGIMGKIVHDQEAPRLDIIEKKKVST